MRLLLRIPLRKQKQVLRYYKRLNELRVAPENRCTPYVSSDYSYPQSVELSIIDQDGLYSPYSGKWFSNRSQSDIEHIIARSEAHDSGLCAVSIGKPKDMKICTKSDNFTDLRKIPLTLDPYALYWQATRFLAGVQRSAFLFSTKVV